MVKLRDYFFSDLDTFINPDEFGEMHKLGSKDTLKDILMVIDDESFGQISGRRDDFENATQSLYESAITIYLKETDFKKPAVGKRLTLDDQKYYVIGSSISDGILRIQLVANESYG